MRIIGLLGGMSWESTSEYYRIINNTVKERLGGLHSAKVALYSVDFAEIEKLQHSGNWAAATEMMIDGAHRVQAAGADCVLICTNTMHKMAQEVAAAISIPLLHIVDATAHEAKASGKRVVGLLGTRFTMEQEFYRGRLERQHGLKVLIPDETDRVEVHRVIYEELCRGIVCSESKQAYLRIVNKMAEQGCEAVILGCTEIGLLIKPHDSPLPLFDTTHIHAMAAVDFALG